jgi:hypothetical protein
VSVPTDPHDGIKAFAATISRQPLGLVLHHPEEWAQATHCFENVWEKVRRSGGRDRFGWTFNYRIAPSTGGYLFATHHAVWHAPDGKLIDVTPYHQDPKHHPIAENGSTLFLVDDAARPVVVANLVGPLPLRYFALGDGEELTAYVAKLGQLEQEECRRIYGWQT